jgi:hypothetical protein
MFRIGIVYGVVLSAACSGAAAESPAERGDIVAYLRTVPPLQ